MRGLVQRVLGAYVDVVRDDGALDRSGQIGPGLCVLVGVTHTDTAADAAKLADKLWGLRVFDDGEGAMNRSLSDLAADGAPAEVLVVSQFTLYADTAKGRRPGWSAAARPEVAEPLVDAVGARLATLGADVATGRFRTEMRVSLVNDGPVTVLVEVPAVRTTGDR